MGFPFTEMDLIEKEQELGRSRKRGGHKDLFEISRLEDIKYPYGNAK
jgi:hypothetical protein